MSRQFSRSDGAFSSAVWYGIRGRTARAYNRQLNHVRAMADSSSSGSPSYNRGDGARSFEAHQELLKASKNTRQELDTASNDVERRSLMLKGNQVMPPVPEGQGATGDKGVPVPDVPECMEAEIDSMCKQGDLRAGHMVIEMCRRLLSDLAEFDKDLREALAAHGEDSDDQDQLAGAQAPANPQGGTEEPSSERDATESD